MALRWKSPSDCKCASKSVVCRTSKRNEQERGVPRFLGASGLSNNGGAGS